MAGIALRHDISNRVVGIGFGSEGDFGEISFASGLQIFDKSRRLPDANRQHARGGWVERSRVSDALVIRHAAHERHRVVAGHAGRLEKIDNTVAHYWKNRIVAG